MISMPGLSMVMLSTVFTILGKLLGLVTNRGPSSVAMKASSVLAPVITGL